MAGVVLGFLLFFFSTLFVRTRAKPFVIIRTMLGNANWQFYCPRNHTVVNSWERALHTSLLWRTDSKQDEIFCID